MVDNQGRLWKSPNSSLAYQLICVGDNATCMKWLGYAQGMLTGLLSRSQGSTSLNCTPDGTVFVEINTRPNSIKITGQKFGSIFIAPMYFHVPDDTLTGYSPSLYAGSYGYWNSFSPDAVNIDNFKTFGGNQLTSQLVFSNMNGNPPHTGEAVYRPDNGNWNVFSSTLDKPVDVLTGLEGKLYGSRGFADQPINNVWLSPDGKAINASVKMFKDYPTYTSCLPPGDTCTYNHFNLGSIYPADALPSTVHNQVPIGLGVYINNIFYTFPTTLTSSTTFTPNTSTGPSCMIAAARTPDGQVLTAVAAENSAAVGENLFFASGYYGIVVGLSTTVTPTVTETVTLANGKPLTVATNSTLNVHSTGYIDTCSGLLQDAASVIEWLEFSPDCNFLYVGMYYTDAIPTFNIGNKYLVSFYIRRWAVLSGGTLSISSGVTIYRSPTYIITTPSLGVYNYIYPIGGFRCQLATSVSGIPYHTLGFVQNGIYNTNAGATAGTTDLQALSFTVAADTSNPTNLSLTTNPPIFLINTWGLSSVPAFYYSSAGMLFVDYITGTFVFGVTSPTWNFTAGDTSSSYSRLALYRSGTTTLLPVNAYTTQGTDIIGWGQFNLGFGMGYGMPICMFGNRCALTPDLKTVYILELVDATTGTFGGNGSDQKFAFIQLDVATGTYKISISPINYELRYIVTSTT